MLCCAHQVVTSIPSGRFWQSLICAAHWLSLIYCATRLVSSAMITPPSLASSLKSWVTELLRLFQLCWVWLWHKLALTKRYSGSTVYILLNAVCTPAQAVACRIIAVVLQPSLRILYLHELVIGIIRILRQSLPVCLAHPVAVAIISISVITYYAAAPQSCSDSGQVLIHVISIIRNEICPYPQTLYIAICSYQRWQIQKSLGLFAITKIAGIDETPAHSFVAIYGYDKSY